jgi:uncharacterized UPF0160 family protein
MQPLSRASSPSDVKSEKIKPTKRIGTHNGRFHCDDVLACFMLQLTDEFKDSEIIRTRDENVLKTLDVLVDVGGVYDPKTHRYDHHQRDFFQTLDDNHKTKLSSAGLIYKHFGKQIISKLLNVDEKSRDIIYDRVYEHFIEALDAIDNGISQYPTEITPNYVITTDLSHRVSYLNPQWNEPSSSNDVDARFCQAMEMAGREFIHAVEYHGKVWLPARQLVEHAIRHRFEVDQSGEIIVLSQFCPWKEHVAQLEKELKCETAIKYVLFPDNDQWKVQCVPVRPSSFETRLPLPEPWRGKRELELSTLVGIEGCIFVHSTGFIGGHKAKEGALQMARNALLEKKK